MTRPKQVFRGRRPDPTPGCHQAPVPVDGRYSAYLAWSSRLDLWPPGSWVRHGGYELAEWSSCGGIPGLSPLPPSRYRQPGVAEALILGGEVEVMPSAAGPDGRGVAWVEVDR